jgi:hypothetical protein
MATSGEVTLTKTANTIVNGALRLLLGDDEATRAVSPEKYKNIVDALNQMIVHWQKTGVGRWQVKDIYVFLQKGNKQSYSLGPTGDHATESFVETELSAAASSGDSTITVDSITGISDGDNIGIVLDDNTIQWTTVNGAPSGSTITLTASLTGDTASGNEVYAYTTIINRPIDIYDATRRRSADDEILIEVVSDDRYFEQFDKYTEGTTLQVYYDPTITNGTLYVWRPSNVSNQQLRLSARMPIDIFKGTDTDADFPDEWIRCLKFNLAVEVYPEFASAMSPQSIQAFQSHVIPMAMKTKRDIMTLDSESRPLQFVPNKRRY